MDWLAWAVPAAVGAATSLVVAYLTARMQIARDREATRREMEARLEDWRRDFALRFAEAADRGGEATRVLGQQFADAILDVSGPGEASGDRHFLPRGVTLTLGRDPACNIRLPDPDGMVSRVHALIDMTGPGAVLVDVSTAGTWVNDADAPLGKAVRHGLSHGDVIRMGGVRARYYRLDGSETVR